jgi:hypothetical protein
MSPARVPVANKGVDSGIGASAGGITALNAFFPGLPKDPGMASVVVQHLPPERESLMVDIRHTDLPVRQIEKGIRVEVNLVYVIRPGFTVMLSQGVFHLGEPVEKRGHRRPVDDFFRSLAQEQPAAGSPRWRRLVNLCWLWASRQGRCVARGPEVPGTRVRVRFRTQVHALLGSALFSNSTVGVQA